MVLIDFFDTYKAAKEYTNFAIKKVYNKVKCYLHPARFGTRPGKMG